MFYLFTMILLVSCKKEIIEKKETTTAQTLCDYSQSGIVRNLNNNGACKNWYIEMSDGTMLAPSSSLDDYPHLKYDGAEILFSYELAAFPYGPCNVIPEVLVHIICADLKSNNPRK